MSHDRHRRPSSSSDVPDRAFTPGRGGRPGGARRSDLVYAGVRPPAGRAEVQRQAAVSSPSIDRQEIEALRQEADASFAAVFERIGPDDGRGQDQVVAPAPARVSSGAMPSAGTAPVQRKAVVDDMDAPKADSIREERATIDPDRGPAAPAARGKGRLAAGGLRRQDVAGHTRGNNAGVVRDTDAPKADSIREERATIEPDADSDAAGPLSPKQAAHAVSRNRHTTAVYRVRPADLDTSAAPDTPAFAQAAARFQQAHGLAVDGIVGPKTTKALHAAGRHQDAHTASQARSAASAVPTKAGQNRQTDVLEDGVLGTGDVLEDGVLGTGDVLEDGVLGTGDVLEDGVLGPDDVLEDGVLGSNDVLEDGLIGQDDPLFARGRSRQQPATRSDQLESGLIDEAVQRKAAGEPSPTLTPMPNTDVPAIAGAGVSGGGQPLPYLQRIQASFGDHDVTGVQAHIGGAAGDAAKQIGALAYATGDHVAFDGAPDLHTAAHEAAHVVQQQHGVQLKGGVGQVGDAHEQHADAVADKVVRGESAEALLDAHAGPAHAGTLGAVQRRVPSSEHTGAGSLPTFAAAVEDLGERMVGSGPGALHPVWIIRQPGELIPAPLSLAIEPRNSAVTDPMAAVAQGLAFSLGSRPAWMRAGETAVMASVQFAPDHEGPHEAELVLHWGDHESRTTLKGRGVADGQLADDAASNGASRMATGREQARGEPANHKDKRPAAPLSPADADSAASDFADALYDLYNVRIEMIRLLLDEAKKVPRPPLEPEEEGFLSELAWMALDVVSAGTAHIIEAAVEEAGAFAKAVGTVASKLVEKSPEITRAGFKLVASEAGVPLTFETVAHKSSAASNDSTLAFFYSQIFALQNAQGHRKELKGKLKEAVTNAPFSKATLDAAVLRLESSTEAIRNLQSDTTLARWISFLSQRSVGSKGGRTDIHAPDLTRFDYQLHVPVRPGAMLDIGVRGPRVVSARIEGTSATILARLYKIDLIANRVPMRVFDAHANSFAVLRDESGGLRITGDVRRFARLRGPTQGLTDAQLQQEGARYLVEEVVGARSLEQHGVDIQDVHR